MNDNADVTSLVALAERYVQHALENDNTGHDYFHADRVRNMALRLRAEENSAARAGIVELAALLHDIGDPKFNGGVDCSDQLIRKLVVEWGGLDELAERVAEIVSQISFKGGFNTAAVVTDEARLVQDADRLDALGAIGIARAFAYGAHKGQKIYDPRVKPRTFASEWEYREHKGTTVNHFFEKLFRLPELLNTASAKKIARERVDFMRLFLARLSEECGVDFANG